ncbi:antibiotic biosynthesis monooxygenase family protein [Williamsia serinedens]|uniref:Heme-degrading monooxygenase HmoA n=1 Tax=Williamsia serinedens TaxID=391736 RepID=A0ABT1H6P8_9NOCA|nr:antibiotic biosynthesis monooxygenase [Williamsia serinedens]MCP2161438.1 Heme-degrading monooxygenase HmoA [Williamsia serinedens]
MITEHALLPVDPDRADEFEAAFDEARHVIAASPGFGGLELLRSIESPDTYLLLVRWESVEAHTGGFRGSSGHTRRKELLHRFYDPFPTVEHFVPITQA